MAAAAIPIVAGVVGAAGSIIGGNAQKKALSDQADIAHANAASALQQAQGDAKIQQIESQKSFGAETASFAAGNIGGQGTLDVLRDSMVNAELDRQNILMGGQARANNYNREASSADRARGSVNTSTLFGVLSSGLNAASVATRPAATTTATTADH